MNCDCGRRHFLRMSMLTLGAVGAAGVAGAALAAEPAPAPKTGKVFICPPCGCDNDGKEFPAAGPCTACGMPLMEKPAEAPKPNNF